MNSAAGYSIDGDMTRGNTRFLLGVGVSVALHVLLMFAYRNTGNAIPMFELEPRPLVVSIRPVPVPEAPRVEDVAPPAQSPAASSSRRVRKAVPKRVIAVPASPEAPSSSEDPFVVQQPAQAAPEPTPGDAPTFDMDAAKQTARKLARQTKLGREGTALAQFPEPPLETESKFAKAISKAKRRNCKDGIPGGLLAPLFLAMDKKDSGCKW